jgi:hypothetical protein
MIRIDRERYLKHYVTDLETLNEPSLTYFPMIGNYSRGSDFENISPLSSDVPLTQKSEMTFQENLLMTVEETLFCQKPMLKIMGQIGGKEESGRQKETDGFHSKIWTLYFDGSKSKEGLWVGCILIDPKGKRNFLSYRLEFECTSNIAKYETLVQGLNKAIDLNIKKIKVFRDSEIVVRQARNTIHCNSPHLRNYQQEVHRLIENF